MSKAAGGAARYARFADVPAIDWGGGIQLRPVAGERLMVSQVTMPADQAAATHTHDEEKLGFVISGHCTFLLDGDEQELGPGDVYVVPPGVPHGR